MAYEVTATRKRPQTFDDLAGQEFVVATIKNSITTGRIAHAYLFSGPRGVGKTSAARILAKSLNCADGPAEVPCGICGNCLEITKGNSLDVIEIDGASNTSVNDVRQIKDEVLFAPANARYKVYIIDEVHMLSNSAFNALLKTIEEPPPYIVFIFATTEIHKVPATIRSRCQQFSFRLIPLDEILKHLRAVCSDLGVTAEEDALLWIAKEATGSLRDAYTLFDQVAAFSDTAITLEKIRDTLGLVGLEQLNGLAEIFVAGNTELALGTLDDVILRGISIEQFILDLAEYFRALLLIKNGVRKPSIIGYTPERFSKSVLDSLHPDAIEHGVSLLFSLYRSIKYSLNPRYELELLVTRLCSLPAFLSPGSMLFRIEEMKKLLIEGRSRGSAPESRGPEKKNFEAKSAIFEEDDDAATDESDDAAATAGKGVGYSGGSTGTLPKTFTEQAQQTLFETLKKREKKITLASSLEKATAWQHKGNELIVVFDSMFSANLVRDDLPLVKKTIAEILGTPVDVIIKIEAPRERQSTESKEGDIDRKVEMVKKVFRGEVIRGE